MVKEKAVIENFSASLIWYQLFNVLYNIFMKDANKKPIFISGFLIKKESIKTATEPNN